MPHPFRSRSFRSLLAAATALLAAGPAVAQETPSWSLAIHGGAGVIQRDQLSAEQEAAFRAGLDQALAVGAAVLRSGGSALDAVQAAVQAMEDNPLFNAGRGAVFTAAGRNELDAAIMDGADLNAGAVAGLTTTRSPVAAARAVMQRSPHVMLIGEGGDAFAASVGLEQVPPAYFFVPRRWTQLRNALERQGLPIPPQPEGTPPQDGAAPKTASGPLADLTPLDERKYGTVGAVAVDSRGHLAAATSTGGVTAKRWGRVGDAPLIGAGTYASDADGCAVSATGTGEYFIRATVARDICRRLGDGVPAQDAAQAEIDEVGALGGDGGVIVIGRDGTAGFAMNTSGMYRGRVGAGVPARTAIFAGEADGR